MRNSKSKTKRRPYPEKYRQKLSERAQKQKPWEHATGPKSPDGKAKSSANAHKTGLHTAQIRKLRSVLRAHKEFLKEIVANATQKRSPIASCFPRESGELLPPTPEDSRFRGKSKKGQEEHTQNRGKLRKRRSTRLAKNGGL